VQYSAVAGVMSISKSCDLLDNVFKCKLTKIDPNSHPYDYDVIYISYDQSKMFNELIKDCAIKDTNIYYDIEKYAKENNLDYSGWHRATICGEKYIEYRVWDEYKGWIPFSVPEYNFPTFTDDQCYIIGYEIIKCLGGNEIFISDTTTKLEFYTIDSFHDFKTHLHYEYKNVIGDLNKDEFIWVTN
jgi:hypothetical protein